MKKSQDLLYIDFLKIKSICKTITDINYNLFAAPIEIVRSSNLIRF